MVNAAFRLAFASSLLLACVLTIMLALPTNGKYGSGNDDWFGMSPEELDEAVAAAAKKLPVNTAMSAAALRKLERIHVMMCAKKITGSDKPRKLAPKVRDEVLKCANDFMPPVQTKALLAESAKELMSAAKTPAQKKDAQAVLAKSLQDSKSVARKASTPDASTTVKKAAVARLAKKAGKNDDTKA